MKDLILQLRDQGKTVLMCSHLLADVQDVCDRIAILHQGELKELGRVDSLLKVRDVTEIRTTALSDAAKAEIKAVIERHHGQLLMMDNPTTTLEELFLNIVRDSEARPGRRAAKADSKSRRDVGRGPRRRPVSTPCRAATASLGVQADSVNHPISSRSGSGMVLETQYPPFLEWLFLWSGSTPGALWIWLAGVGAVALGALIFSFIAPSPRVWPAQGGRRHLQGAGVERQ